MKLGASKLKDVGRNSLFTAAHCTPKQWRNSNFVAQIVAQPLDVSIPHFRRCIHLIFMLEFWSWDLEKLLQWHHELRLKAWKVRDKIWANLIVSMINEIGWICMLNCVCIEYWLGQFEENLIGSIFPQISSLAEFDMYFNVLGFLIFDNWKCWKSFGMMI